MACGCSPMKRPLKGKQKNLPKHLQEKILSSPVKRLKYCSGKSKPFKKLKKY
jgi:hypothetical protein